MTQYPSYCPFPLPSLLIWGLTMLQSCQSTQGGPKGCTFPLLCAELGEKVQEKKSWSHWATPFPCNSAGRQSRSGQGRDIPSCLLQPTTPGTVWPRVSEQTQHNILSLHPTHCGTGRQGTEGWGCLQLPVPSWDCVSWSEKQSCVPRECQGFQGRNLVQQQRHKQHK